MGTGAEVALYAAVAASATGSATAEKSTQDQQQSSAQDQQGQQDQQQAQDYGNRPDGTAKGTGFFGPLKMKNGSGNVMTEFSVGTNIDGKETLIPTLVPTLNKQELNHLLGGGKPTPTIVNKAARFAIDRMKQGKSPFIEPGEQTSPVPK